jgi:hypothetical protein
MIMTSELERLNKSLKEKEAFIIDLSTKCK